MCICVCACVDRSHDLPSLQQVTVLLSPGVKEFPVACFPIWIIIVAVIGGFLCLALLGTLVGCVSHRSDLVSSNHMIDDCPLFIKPYLLPCRSS